MLCLTACADTHTHAYSAEWSYSDTHHYHETTCGHDVDPADCDGYAMHTLVNGACSVCDYIKPLTLNEFATDHNKAATDFIKNKIRPSVVGNKEVKAEYAYIVGNSENALSQVNIVWTYSVNDTDRKVELANVTLPAPVTFRNIVNDNYTINASELDINRTDIFTFNAQRNYNKQNVAAALYAKADVAADVKLYAEIDSDDAFYRSFNLLGLADGKISVTQIDVLKGDGTQEALLQNIDRPFTQTSVSSEHNIDGANIYGSPYVLEDLGPETEQPTPPDPIDPGPDPGDKIENVQDLIAKYASTVKIALNDNYLYNMGRQCIGRSFKTEKVLDTQWYINDGESISEIEIVFKYDEINGFVSHIIGKIELSAPINVKNLTKDTIASALAENSSDATYSQAYSFSYNDQMGTQRLELKNAICDKFFGENEGAIRYIRDIGSGHNEELKELRQFTVIEITEKGVKEISINIKNSSSDNEYIAKLSDSSKYRTYNEKSYTISGVKVENNDSPFAAD